ncbi:MAG: DUF3325 domain-containing protein [Pseudomonadota bacterium]
MIEFVLTVAGTALLCLSMRKHWKQVLPGRARSQTAAMAIRSAGYCLLLAAAVMASIRYGTGVGLTLFFALLTVAVFGIALLLPVWQRGREP